MKKKTFVTIVIVSFLLILVLVVGGVLLGNYFDNKPNNEIPTDLNNSAVVSSGVHELDLGNIVNGQYYFETDELVFYSSFDILDHAHIYSVKKDGTEHKPIFDGFGWSLVVIEDWLYFSGNEGTSIDGTYHIYRMKLDGSQLENINNEYSYGMFLYGNYLYYMKKNPENQDNISICRSSLDGKNEEMLFPIGYSPLVYKKQLYYYDNQGNMYKTEPDGTNPKVLLVATVKTYVLSNEKIVYVDLNNNIYTCDLNGANNTLIRSSKDLPVYNLNVYDNQIFYSEYDPIFNYSLYGYNYTIKSCKTDGSDEKTVFSSVSYGIYMNIVNGKLMLMDYYLNTSSGEMITVIKIMDLEGSNVGILER